MMKLSYPNINHIVLWLRVYKKPTSKKKTVFLEGVTMISVSMLDAHHSSPKKDYGDFEALSKRRDLYTGKDFYFGFDSSNKTFLDIIGGKQPLAIKYGPILAIYRQHMDGYEFKVYFINANDNLLHPIIGMTTQAKASATLERCMPFSFQDFYLETSDPLAVKDEQVIKSEHTSPEDVIRGTIEQLAKSNYWPGEMEFEPLRRVVDELNEGENVSIELLADFETLTNVKPETLSPPSIDNFMSPYNPFCDNPRVSVEELRANNPGRITVRQIHGRYPRIEIIAADVGDEDNFNAIFQSKTPELYDRFKESLKDPDALKELLEAHFPALISQYQLKYGGLPSTVKGHSSAL